ncbi:MAG TPA: hypothetical protein VGB70_10440 [Allosphingosinicella sp.]
MSMTLTFWKAPLVPDSCAANVLLRRWYKKGDDRDLEPSASIKAFADELLRRFPPEGARPEGGECPWADLPFEQTDRVVEVDLRWGADPEAIDAICALAREYGLLMYDPQSGDVHLPHDPAEPEVLEVPPLTAWIKITLITTALAGATYMAWQIPSPWLRWPLVAIAAFITASSLFVLGAMLAHLMGFLNEKAERTALP